MATPSRLHRDPGPDAGRQRGGAELDSLRARVAGNPLWYHTLELAPGVVTPGWWDLRPVTDRMPWPDVRGKRCLDVGTYDGHLAFELERRGAAEVVATDIGDHRHWDWPITERERGPEHLAELAGPEKGTGFAIAREALASSVERVELSIYELSPERLGSFDVVVCGALLLHLRDPLRALEALRSVCRDRFLSAEQIDPALTVAHPRSPACRLNGVRYVQWWVPNAAAHRRMLRAAGFEIERASRPYAVPFGSGHADKPSRWSRRALASRLLTRSAGVAYTAVLARRPG